ncbi:MAG: hypothetical protein JSS86_09455, partial [Cyanobacteria bacterium SZAS LIN-2]|nr:hypothetical protein [Cyanobacteria bacterium SZAS LIN-2]
MSELIPIVVCCVLGLMAHGSIKHRWLEWMIRLFMAFFAMLTGVTYLAQGMNGLMWGFQVTSWTGVLAGALLFLPFRKVLHRLLTILDGIASLRIITGPMRHKMTALASMVSIPIFVPTSIPHMVGAFIYVATFGLYLANTDLSGFNAPTIPLPMMPLPIDTLFSYNGFGLVAVSVCGVGIFISRKPKELCARLGWQKPTAQQ